MASQWEIEFARIPSAAETLRVDDLLDLTHHDLSSSSSSSVAAEAGLLPAAQLTAGDVSDFEIHCPRHASFADNFYIPSDEVAELEWLSKFVEDSFSDVLPAEAMAPTTTRGARSKRSRGAIAGAESDCANQHAASDWATLAPSSSTTSSSSSSSDFSMRRGSSRKKQGAAETGEDGRGMRRCAHCASEKTPQWRTGPLGPKTLCNACGVRFKAGRLVPEYRPAASPTFVPTQHSNSHRKVMELRRQKEVLILRRRDGGSSSASFPVATIAAGGTEMLFHGFDIY